MGMGMDGPGLRGYINSCYVAVLDRVQLEKSLRPELSVYSAEYSTVHVQATAASSAK